MNSEIDLKCSTVAVFQNKADLAVHIMNVPSMNINILASVHSFDFLCAGINLGIHNSPSIWMPK